MNKFSIMTLIKLAIRNIYLLITVALLAGILAFSFCQFIATPKYSASGSVLVTNGAIISRDDYDEVTSQSISGTDISASLKLSNTIIDILRTNDIYKELSENLNNKYTYGDLMGRSSIKRRNSETLFIDVSFTAQTQTEAQTLVNNFLVLAPDYIIEYIPGSTASVVTTADRAVKTFPRTIPTTILVSIVATIACFALIYIIHLFNNTIKNEDDIRENYDLLIIGNIPDFATVNSKTYYKYHTYSPYSQQGGSTNAKQ